MSVTQKGIRADGDVVAGDKHTTINHNYKSGYSSIAKLYEKLRADDSTYQASERIRLKLNHFNTPGANSDVRDLQKKLTDGNRAYLINQAIELKQDAAMLVAEWQTSGVAQEIITLLLAKIHTDFIMNASPAIQAKKPDLEIDRIIKEKVIDPAIEMLGDNDLMITDSDILGFLFFLGGNCHIRWDAC
ncbi:MAG: hypothetical protein PHE74_00030 [Comamonas sp.]|nr:hypothetical protein [Comamonas sp.]